MPYKFTQNFDQLELIIIHFSNNFWRPKLMELTKLFLEIYFSTFQFIRLPLLKLP